MDFNISISEVQYSLI